jgi:hypothetical protein
MRNADLKGDIAPVDRIPIAADRRGAVPDARRQPRSGTDCGTVVVIDGHHARRREVRKEG